MAPILEIGAELHLKIFEAVTDLEDLIFLLESSDKLSEVFRKHFRGLLKTTIIPRLAPGNTAAVQKALQAVCSNFNLVYHHWVLPSELPPSSVRHGAIRTRDLADEEKWQTAALYDIWNADPDRFWPLEDVLQHLLDISFDVNAFSRFIRRGKGQIYRKAQQLGDAMLEEILWELQTWTLRFTNVRAVKRRGDRSQTMTESAANVLENAVREWQDSLPDEEHTALVGVVNLAKRADLHLRRHLLVPSRDGLVSRLVYCVEDGRLSFKSTLSHENLGQMASMQIASRQPLIIMDRHRAAYQKFSRKVHRDAKVNESSLLRNAQHGKEGAADRITRVRANLAAYLKRLQPFVQIGASDTQDLVSRIGRSFSEEAERKALQGDSPLEKHLRMVSMSNRYGRRAADVDNILPDVRPFFRATEGKW